MASSPENVSMALFCDFENVALGVRDAKYEKFDIKPILERLLLKGSIVVKKAYCDWDRYKGFKATMHEANFELIEIPHVRQSGKNSADIRLVVDALDLCYTKSHVNTFVIISGDSDFSPLVSKLRENAKQVIGVGVKQSTSDLLIANCDEFIFYDDLVREIQRASARREPRDVQPEARRSAEEEKRRRDEKESRKTRAIEMAVETFDALLAERGDSGKIWASVLKEAIKRRKPDFNESYYGFRAFGNLLEEAQARGLLEFGRDEKSGAYVYRTGGGSSVGAPTTFPDAPAEAAAAPIENETAPAEAAGGKHDSRRRGRGGRKSTEQRIETAPMPEAGAEQTADPAPTEEPAPREEPRRKSRGGRKPAGAKAEATAAAPEAAPTAAAAPVEEPAPRPDKRRKSRGGRSSGEQNTETPAAPETPVSAEAATPPGTDEGVAKPARKPASRSRRPRKQEE